MLNLSKTGNNIYILYGAKNYSTGETVVAEIYDETDAKFGSDITLSEIGTTGLYGNTFTPDANGEWKVKIKEDTQYRAHASIKMTSHDIVSVGGDVTSIKNVVENVTYGNSALKDKLDGIEGSGFATGSDSLVAIKDYLVNTIQSSISEISNNTRTAVSIPSSMLKPISGTSYFKIYVNIYDSEGNMEDPDDQDAGAEQAMVSVNVTDESGNDRTGNLSGLSASTQDGLDWMTRESEGRFSCIYGVSSTHDLEQLLFNFAYEESSVGRNVDRVSIVTDVLDISDEVGEIYAEITDGTYGLSALKTLLDAVDTDLTNIEGKIDVIDTTADNNYSLLTNGTYGLAALQTLISGIDTDITAVQADLTAVKGSGFITGTDSLKALSDRQQAMAGAGFSTGTDSLEAISDAIAGIDLGTGGYIG